MALKKTFIIDHSKVKVLAKPKFGLSNRRFSIIYEYIESDRQAEIRVFEFSILRLLLNKYDIIHVHWPDRVFASSGFRPLIKVLLLGLLFEFCKLRKTKIIWTVHNPHIKFKHECGVKTEDLYYRMLFKQVNHFIFPSSESQRTLEEKFREQKLFLKPQSCSMIPLGIQEELFAEGEARPQDLPLEENGYFLIVGRITAEKNILETIESIKPVLRVLNRKLIVAGKCNDPSLIDSLMQNSDDYVYLLLRFLTDEEINYLIAKSFALLINYEVTNSGVATLAAAHKKAVFFSNENYAEGFANDYDYSSSYSFEALLRDPGRLYAAVLEGVFAPRRSIGLSEVARQYLNLFSIFSGSKVARNRDRKQRE
ncbi:hypothetical protein IMCC14465_05020 [alpha proteobacterium IMCC14465]|uniref:Glycosyl transferase family 1 domain-containing protein n=1 Tax=alpha proteobacterium IMCC14465 TaxID=1220535 RepID=J9DJ41_9PROT|nr:hypothetical protein IMCC14465_05020 [alpha proteobacterium IMCC14465]